MDFTATPFWWCFGSDCKSPPTAAKLNHNPYEVVLQTKILILKHLRKSSSRDLQSPKLCNKSSATKEDKMPSEREAAAHKIPSRKLMVSNLFGSKESYWSQSQLTLQSRSACQPAPASAKRRRSSTQRRSLPDEPMPSIPIVNWVCCSQIPHRCAEVRFAVQSHLMIVDVFRHRRILEFELSLIPVSKRNSSSAGSICIPLMEMESELVLIVWSTWKSWFAFLDKQYYLGTSTSKSMAFLVMIWHIHNLYKVKIEVKTPRIKLG